MSKEFTRHNVSYSKGKQQHQRVVPTKEPLYHSSPTTSPMEPPFEPTITPNLDLLAVQTVRPVITGRSLVINRTVADPFSRGSRNYQSERVQRVSAPLPTAYLNNSGGVEAMMESRGKEKRELQDLNERLANYLEKVRFLEAQNKNLTNELEKLKEKWGKETSQVKKMYQLELDEARKVLDGAVEDKGKLEIKVASLEDIIEELRNNLDEARNGAESWKEKWQSGIQRVSDAEAELLASKKMMEGLSEERERERRRMSNLQELLSNCRKDLDNESFKHLQAATKLQTLEEELEFLKDVHTKEMEEMALLANRDTTADNRNFWKNEMGSALKEIQEVYEMKIDEIKIQCENNFSAQIQEYKTGASRTNMQVGQSREENKRLKSSLIDLRNRLSLLEGQNVNLQQEMDRAKRDGESREREMEAEKLALQGDILRMRSEMDAIMVELQHLNDSKLGLELEISAYRKLLESEEHRVDDLEAQLRKARAPNLNTYYYGNRGGSEDRTNESNRTERSVEYTRNERGNEYNSGDRHSDYNSQSYGRDANQADPSMRNETKRGRLTFQRTCKGPCVINEASEDGRCVVIDNSGRRDENIGGWVLKKFISGREAATFVFPHNFVLKCNSQIKIWARGYRPRENVNDLETPFSSWGRSSEVVMKLFNSNSEEKASLTQTSNG